MATGREVEGMDVTKTTVSPSKYVASARAL
jgi:hypothetical protein